MQVLEQGKQSHMLSMFHLGLGFDRDVAGKPQKFKSFCRVAPGFTNKELIQVSVSCFIFINLFRKLVSSGEFHNEALHTVQLF